MNPIALPLTAVLLVLTGMAKADDLIAQRPGLMCEDPASLAKLTLPDGSSKLTTARATPADKQLSFLAQCVEIPIGARMPMGERHRNTSMVYYQGSNGPKVYTVPNVDFSEPLPSPPAERSFAELRLNAAGFDLKSNRTLGLTCQPAEYVHGVGMVLDCKVPASLTVESAGIGIPSAIPCAAGAVQLLPDGSFRMCKLTQPISYIDFQHKNRVCAPGRTLARDMSGNEPDPTAYCN